MSYTDFKIDCIHQIESSIKSASFTRNHTSIRISYRVGRNIARISLPTRHEAAKFFQRHGIIDQFELIGDDVHMYEKKLVTKVDDTKPVQFEVMTRIEWEEINLTETQIQTIAANNEWNNVKRIVKFSNYVKSA